MTLQTFLKLDNVHTCRPDISWGLFHSDGAETSNDLSPLQFLPKRALQKDESAEDCEWPSSRFEFVWKKVPGGPLEY